MPQSPQTDGTPTPAADNFPLDELSRHRGRWVALSPDGRRLVASATTLADLDAQVRAAGEDPEEILLERVPDGAYIASGSDLS